MINGGKPYQFKTWVSREDGNYAIWAEPMGGMVQSEIPELLPNDINNTSFFKEWFVPPDLQSDLQKHYVLVDIEAIRVK